MRQDPLVAEFEAFYRAHLESVVRYVSQRCTGVDAVDVVAETFSIAWRRFDEITDKANARPWLYGVARRVLSNHRRASNRRHELERRIHQEWVPAGTPAVPLRLEPLRLALLRLAEADREILMLAGVEEFSPAEISVVLDISPGAARTRLSRARSRLEAALGEIDIDETNEGRIRNGL